jgi:hypothetical protein
MSMKGVGSILTNNLSEEFASPVVGRRIPPETAAYEVPRRDL